MVETKPEWEITFEEFLRRLNFTARNFRERLDLPVVSQLKKVLPLRDLKKVNSIIPVSEKMLFGMLKSIKTSDGQYPFKNSEFKILKIDPRQLKIGQKYAYRENWIQLMQDLPDLFSKHSVLGSGITHLGAFIIFGTDTIEESAMAFYIPPIVEQHGNDLVVMDGIHRNYIVKQIGVSITAIEAKKVSVDFPCSCQEWSELRSISLTEKPLDINERYFDLRKPLFRDLKYLGIDG